MNLSIHYDCDGVLRNFHAKAFEVFFARHPEYKNYVLPVEKFKGWAFKDQLKKGPDAEKIDNLMWKELFNDSELSQEVFGNAEPLVSREDWKRHIEMILKEFPDANIVISTHQYNDPTREATTHWLGKHGFTDEDKISILYTGKKDLFGAHFLLDDKPTTIESFHKPYESIGVLRLNPYSNGWYLRKSKGRLKFPFAKTLDDYYKIISEKAIELL